MKGFGIYVKNNLLEPKHVSAMGEQTGLWLYLWFLDHMTSISEEGIGLVLGGKPVTFEQIGEELGMSRSGFTRWIARLKKCGYISTRRTPRGQVVWVHKAEKIFGNKYDASKVPHHSDEPKVARDQSKLALPSTETDASNIDNTVDNTRTVIANGKPSAPSPHKTFIKFWHDTTINARRVKPVITGADAKNLQRILRRGDIDEQALEKMAAYFLGSWHYKQFAPSISTFLSSGIINGLMNKMQNDPEFWKEMDQAAVQYVAPQKVESGKFYDLHTQEENQERIRQNLAKLRQALADKFKMDKREVSKQ